MPRFDVDKRSINLTISNFRGSQAKFKRAATVATNLAGVRLLEAIRRNVSMPPIGGSKTSHEGALAGLGHPYARRHGSIRYRATGGKPSPGVAPELLVHTVTGDMASAFFAKFNRSTLEFAIGTDLAKAPHLVHVIRGTAVMLPRDILWATAQDPAVRREMLRAIVFVFGRVFRTQASLRFS